MSVLQVSLEVGPKEKRVVAFAPQWPGLERGAKNDTEAMQRLLDYVPRYAKVAKLAKRDAEFSGVTRGKEIERYSGTGSTDFWGISFAFSSIDQRDLSDDELERELSLMRACWTYFDQVRSRVSPVMQKGPRGGGRDRDRIVLHTIGAEQDFAKKLSVRTSSDEVTIEPKELKRSRDSYCAAIREHHAQGTRARNWPLRYLIRHTAFHTMDHAWEMEDKDMTLNL